MTGLIVFMCAIIALIGTVVVGNRKKLKYLKNQVSEYGQLIEILILRNGKEKREAEKDQNEGSNGRNYTE